MGVCVHGSGRESARRGGARAVCSIYQATSSTGVSSSSTGASSGSAIAPRVNFYFFFLLQDQEHTLHENGQLHLAGSNNFPRIRCAMRTPLPLDNTSPAPRLPPTVLDDLPASAHSDQPRSRRRNGPDMLKGVHTRCAHTEGRGALCYSPDGRYAKAICRQRPTTTTSACAGTS